MQLADKGREERKERGRGGCVYTVACFITKLDLGCENLGDSFIRIFVGPNRVEM